MSNHHQKLDSSDPRNFYCRNCHHKHSSTDVHFCSSCGQKNTDGRTTMHEIWHEFMHNTLHLDGKFFKMMRHLFLPGMLTSEFFKGRQKRYPHPTRFFLVITGLFLVLFNSTLRTGEKMDFEGTPSKEKFSLGIGMKLTQNFDSLPANLRTPAARATLDSLLQKSDLNNQDTFRLSNMGKTFSFSMKDLSTLSPDSLIKKYKIEGFFDKITVKQSIKLADDPKLILRAWVGTMTATILLLLALMSPILWLLFRKTRPFYVEHFIFLMHHTTTLLLGISIFMLLSKISFLNNIADKLLGVWWIGWMAAGMLFAMKRFYQRSWKEIIAKWLVVSVLYAFIGILSMVFSLLVAFFVLV
jgi:hypothetical protein